MINTLITDIEQAMLKMLNNEQLEALHNVLNTVFENVTVISTAETEEKANNSALVTSFLSAKRIEGCSEKTLSYYNKTIETALFAMAKDIKQITTDDLRKYFTDYQEEKQSSKVTKALFVVFIKLRQARP